MLVSKLNSPRSATSEQCTGARTVRHLRKSLCWTSSTSAGVMTYHVLAGCGGFLNPLAVRYASEPQDTDKHFKLFDLSSIDNSCCVSYGRSIVQTKLVTQLQGVCAHRTFLIHCNIYSAAWSPSHGIDTETSYNRLKAWYRGVQRHLHTRRHLDVRVHNFYAVYLQC